MKITIELDLKSLKEVEVLPPATDPPDGEPPPELLAAARRLGAESAGAAAFTYPAHIAPSTGALSTTTANRLPDVDAGHAEDGAGPPPAKKTRAKAAKGLRSRVKIT